MLEVYYYSFKKKKLKLANFSRTKKSYVDHSKIDIFWANLGKNCQKCDFRASKLSKISFVGWCHETTTMPDVKHKH